MNTAKRRSTKRSVGLFCGAVFLGFLLYRVLFYLKILTLKVYPSMFVPEMHNLLTSFYNSKSDFEAALVLSLLFALPFAVPAFRRAVWLNSAWRSTVLIAIGAIAMTQYELILGLNQGFDIAALEEFGMVTWRDIWGYTSPLGLTFLFSPLLLDFILRHFAKREHIYRAVKFALIALVVGAYALRLGPKTDAPRRELFANPVIFLAQSVQTYAKTRHSKYNRMHAEVSALQSSSLPFVEPTWMGPRRSRETSVTIPQRAGKKWNVLFVVLESVGASYPFAKNAQGQMPMPFLYGLKQQSLALNEHRSNSNTSFRTAFSIFTGLYPELSWNNFSLRANNCVPSVFDYLDDEYDKFLVLGSHLDSFFPKSLFLNSGVTDLFGAKEIETPRSRPHPPNGMSDLDTLEFFLARLQQSKPPFAAVYLPYGAHFDYFDYDPQHRYIEEPRTPFDRYQNNLHTVDRSIEKIFADLKSRRLLDDTIVIFVGDHGEAFGQHPGNWTHSRAMFEENLRVPAFVWQPKLFRTTAVNEPTDHSDLLPTLLSAMGKLGPGDEALFQGHDLTRFVPTKLALPGFGNDSSLCSLEAGSRIKVCVRETSGTCDRYDLATDPHETRPLPCDDVESQVRRVKTMQRYQNHVLDEYNKAIIAKRPSFGALTLKPEWLRHKARTPACGGGPHVATQN